MSAAPILVPTPAGFLRDGEPHQIISGALHYTRVHPDLWTDRLRRLRAMGCDTVETYVAWNAHQSAPGVTSFTGGTDLGRFLDLAAQEGLDAIVRPGPYICGEWENGGFPGWLLADRNLRLRCSDPAYLAHVDAWFDELIPVIASRQASRGGNVVMVQVENEYGSFGDDAAYLEHLRDGLRARGIDELLVTSDGPARAWLTGGTVDGALATVNYGSRTQDVLAMAREELPDQPLMCMEFWNGWFDHWGERHHTRPAEEAAAELETMLSAGMSVNFYMAHGGTNLGLSAGANTDEHGRLQPTTTSYDYDAPIAEDGTLTPKFHAFREVIARHRELPPLAAELERLGISEHPARVDAGEVRIEATAPLLSWEGWTAPGQVHPQPPAFEDLGLERGLLLLRREVELIRTDAADKDGTVRPRIAPVRLHDLHDRAWVLIDGQLVGAVEGTGNPAEPAIVERSPRAEQLVPGGPGHRTVRLEVLVENLGRVNFGPLLGERKGVLGGIWHGMRFLNAWEAIPLPLEELGEALGAHARAGQTRGDGQADALPRLIAAAFDADAPAVADLDLTGWGHGAVWVNGVCIGRFWDVGPQFSLHVPAPIIRAGRNEVLVLQLDATGPALPELRLADGPIFVTPSH